MDFFTSFNKQPVFIAPETIEVEHISKPAYPKKVTGVCLVVGTAPCVHEDVEEALLAYPDATICAVNEAGALLPADYLVTCHGDKIEQFLELQENAFGIFGDDNPMPELHMKDISEATTERPAYRWQISIGAGSAPFAAAIMALIGYELVIFCGCPMDGGGGYAMETHKGTDIDPRFGDLDQSHQLVRTWKDQLYHMKQDHPDLCDRFRSMSGFTKHIFGGI